MKKRYKTYTSNNKYYNVPSGSKGTHPNCTKHAQQCVIDHSGQVPQWQGNPFRQNWYNKTSGKYVNSINDTIWNINDGYKTREPNEKPIVGDVAIFDFGYTSPGHVAYVYKVNNKGYYLSEQDYYQKGGNYYTTRFVKHGTKKVNGGILVGFKATHMSLKTKNNTK